MTWRSWYPADMMGDVMGDLQTRRGIVMVWTAMAIIRRSRHGSAVRVT